VSVQDGDIALAIDAADQALVDAAQAQATANGKITTYYQGTAPGSASQGDIWVNTSQGNNQYMYTVSGWVDIKDADIEVAIDAADQALVDAAQAQATANGKITTYYQGTAPSSASQGDIWVNTSQGNNQYMYTASGWVDIKDTDITVAINTANRAVNDADQALIDAAKAQQTADGKIQTFRQSTAPNSAQADEGDIWINTAEGNNQYMFTSAGWIDIQDTAIVQAQTTADRKITTYYQGTAPSGGNLSTGDIWYNTNLNNRPYRWTGSNWQVVRDEGLIDDAKSVGKLFPQQNDIQIQSDDYIAGTRGWAIWNSKQTGKSGCEFANGIFRGTVYVEDLIGDTYENYITNILSNVTNIQVNRGSTVYRTISTFDIPQAAWERKMLIPAGTRFYISGNTSGGAVYLEYLVNGELVYTAGGAMENAYLIDGIFHSLAKEVPLPSATPVTVQIRLRCYVNANAATVYQYGAYYAGSLVHNVYK
ncbi:hypothetical protein, partial [Vibrio sp. H11]|uniref:hypothetical protein n=1 Tax=Vibrio sp. H11 TaxID=2565928 RepID=UPI0019819044